MIMCERLSLINKFGKANNLKGWDAKPPVIQPILGSFLTPKAFAAEVNERGSFTQRGAAELPGETSTSVEYISVG